MCNLKKNASPSERLKAAVDCAQQATYDISSLARMEEKYGLDFSVQKDEIANSVLTETMQALAAA